MTGHFQVWFPPPQLAPDAPPGVPLKLTDRKPLYVPSPCSHSRELSCRVSRQPPSLPARLRAAASGSRYRLSAIVSTASLPASDSLYSACKCPAVAPCVHGSAEDTALHHLMHTWAS